MTACEGGISQNKTGTQQRLLKNNRATGYIETLTPFHSNICIFENIHTKTGIHGPISESFPGKWNVLLFLSLKRVLVKGQTNRDRVLEYRNYYSWQVVHNSFIIYPSSHHS